MGSVLLRGNLGKHILLYPLDDQNLVTALGLTVTEKDCVYEEGVRMFAYVYTHE